MLDDKTLYELQQNVTRLIALKMSMERTKEIIGEINEAIEELIPAEAGKKQSTVSLPSGFKVTVARGSTTKVDVAGIEALLGTDEFKDMPSPLASKSTVTLDMTGYEWYRVNHPNKYVKIAEYVTSKPKTAAISVKPPKGE